MVSRAAALYICGPPLASRCDSHWLQPNMAIRFLASGNLRQTDVPAVIASFSLDYQWWRGCNAVSTTSLRAVGFLLSRLVKDDLDDLGDFTGLDKTKVIARRDEAAMVGGGRRDPRVSANAYGARLDTD